MAIVPDPVTVLNLAFDLIILCLGALVYARMKKRGTIGLCIAIAFALFAASYVITILGFGSLTAVLVPLRVAGYLSVIAGLYLYLRKR